MLWYQESSNLFNFYPSHSAAVEIEGSGRDTLEVRGCEPERERTKQREGEREKMGERASERKRERGRERERKRERERE